jgi:hypothetical protein
MNKVYRVFELGNYAHSHQLISVPCLTQCNTTNYIKSFIIMDTLNLFDLNIKMWYKFVDSPLGRIMLLASDKGLKGIWFEGQRYYPAISPQWMMQDSEVLVKAEQAVKEYFMGRVPTRTFEFDL